MTVSAWKIPLPISAVQSDKRDGFIKVQGSRKAGGENEMLSLSHLQQIPSWETQRVPQLVKQFHAFYFTRHFMAVFTTARHLYWAKIVKHTPSYTI